MSQQPNRFAFVTKLIDQQCDQFETDWNAGREPQIESYLLDLEGEERLRLIRELIMVEIDLLNEDQREIPWERLRTRFPDLLPFLDKLTQEQATHKEDMSRTVLAGDSYQQGLNWPGNQVLSWQGGLKIRGLHAAGGLGEVYTATDSQLQRKVAVKLVKPEILNDAPSLQRFRFEAEVTGRLEHPGIVPVHGSGTDSHGRPFYVMKFIRGNTLATQVEQHFSGIHDRSRESNRLEHRRLLNHFVAACRAIAYAHHRGVIHRDIKPSNIMLGAFGETMVIDWGLAKVVDDDREEELKEDQAHRSEQQSPHTHGTAAQAEHQTIDGTTVGTPVFMSPEQAEGRVSEIDIRTDVYGLGATLYVLLTGKRPIQGRLAEVSEQVIHGRFDKPRLVRKSVPKPLEAICLKAMQRQPTMRYQSADELASDIEAYLADEHVSAWREPLHSRAQRFLRRRQSVLLAMMLALTLLAVMGVSYAYHAERKAKSLAIENAKVTEELSNVFEGLYGGMMSQQKPTFLLGVDYRSIDLEEAVGKVETNLKSDPLIQAHILDPLGEHYSMMGDFKNSDRCLSAAYEIRSTEIPGSEEHSDTLHHLAFLRWAQGDLASANTLVEQAIQIRTRQFGLEHPKTIASKILLLLTMSETKYIHDPRVRAAFSRRSVKAWQDILEAKNNPDPSEDPDIAGIYLLIASYQADNSDPSAISSFLKARKAFDRYNDQHNSNVTTRGRVSNSAHIGELLTLWIEPFLAKQVPLLRPLLSNPDGNYDRALELAKTAFNQNEMHPGNIYMQLKMTPLISDPARKEQELRRLTEEASVAFAGTYRLADFYDILGEHLLAQALRSDDEEYRSAQFLDAEQLMQKSLQLRQQIDGGEKWSVAVSYKLLGRLERDRNNLKESERYFRLAMEAFDEAEIRGVHWLDGQCLGELAGVLELQGRDEEANQLRQEGTKRVESLDSEVDQIVDSIFRAVPELGR